MPSKPDSLARRAACDEAFDDLLDLGLGHGMAAVGIVEGGQTRGRPARLVGIVEIAVLADMIELMADHRAMRMDGIGDFAEMRNDLVGRVAEIAARQNGGAMHRHRLDDDHRSTAARALLVIAAMPLAGQAHVRHVGGVRAEDDAIAQGLVAKLQRLEQGRKLVRHQTSSRASSGENRRPHDPSSRRAASHDWHRSARRSNWHRSKARPRHDRVRRAIALLLRAGAFRRPGLRSRAW